MPTVTKQETDLVADRERLEALESYGILDTMPEQGFDDIVFLAARVCAAPVALVSLVSDDRQWFKARVGFAPTETPIEQSVCAHAVGHSGLLVIPDLAFDERTRANTLVTDDPHLRFYAGAPLRTASGATLGTLCVIDHTPRPEGLTDVQAEGLRALARQVMAQLELRRAVADRDTALAGRRRDEQRYREVQERLQIALNASGVIGLWDWMVDTDLLHGDANFARLYGLDVTKTAAGLTMEQYQEFVVPEDLTHLRASIRATFERGADFLVEYRLDIPGQSLRWVECKGQLVDDGDGRPERFSGSAVDITRRKLAENETRRLAAIVEQSGDFIGAANLDGKVVWVNECGRRLVGLTDAASAKATTIRDYFDPVQWPEIVTTVFPAVDRNGHWRGELRFRHFGTGELIPVIYDVIALRDAAGAVSAYATVTRDIREQKAAEERQRILNEELAHRMKNMLAMVQAIATQTLKGVSEKDAVAAFNKRLQALASAHGVLLQQSWAAANMRIVVDAVLGTFDMGDRFDVSGPDVDLGPRTTLSLSLLLHELTTNALKYGALSSDGGRVRIAWNVDRTGDEPEIVMGWIESGGPTPAEPERRGFGSRLIGMGLTGTGGSELRYPANGFQAAFRAPLSQVQQS